MASTEIARIEKVLDNKGFMIYETRSHGFGTIVSAKIEAGKEMMFVDWHTNGNVRIQKPNGKVKMYFEKSAAQINRILVQILDCWDNYKERGKEI